MYFTYRDMLDCINEGYENKIISVFLKKRYGQEVEVEYDLIASKLDLTDDYEKIRICYDLYTRTFPMPLFGSANTKEDIEAYFKRIGSRIRNDYSKDFKSLIIRTMEFCLPARDILTVYLQHEHAINQILKGDNYTQVFSAFQSNTSEEISKFGVKISNYDINALDASGPFPSWMQNIKTWHDMYKSPLNEEYWDKVPYLDDPSNDVYHGTCLYISSELEQCLIKTDGFWIPIDKEWLFNNTHKIPESIRQEVQLYKNIK